jgi:hypothetical protein
MTTNIPSTWTSPADIAKPVIDTLQAKVSEKIKSSFLELIPEETFDSMVASAMHEFVNGTAWAKEKMQHKVWDPVQGIQIWAPYNPTQDPDTLPGMIMGELKAEAKKRLIEIMSAPEYQNIWKGSEQVAGKAISDIVANNSEQFVAALFGELVGKVLTQVRINMQQGRF